MRRSVSVVEASEATSTSTSSPATGPTHEMIDRARQLADELLLPHAQDVDRSDLIPPSHLRALADAGLFGIAGPPEAGGRPLPPPVGRRVFAAIGGGCGATFFVWAQHHGVVRTVAASSNAALRDELLAAMCAGDLLCGVAFAHVRRRGRAAIRATRVEGGWRLDGHAPWTTSWGLADHFAIAAESVDGELVWAILPGRGADGLDVAPLALPLFMATGTVTMDFDGCLVPDERIALVEDADRWRATDRFRSSIGQPAVLGVAERAIDLLGGPASGADTLAADAATRLREELDTLWRHDDDLVARVSAPPPADVDVERLIDDGSRHRSTCLDLARRATTAYLAAVAGRGMTLDHPAQRLAREADFYVIQAQTADGRAATLASV